MGDGIIFSHFLTSLDSIDPKCLLASVKVQCVTREQNQVNIPADTEAVTLSSLSLSSNHYHYNHQQQHPALKFTGTFLYATVKLTLARDFHTMQSDAIQCHLFQHDNIVLHFQIKFSR